MKHRPKSELAELAIRLKHNLDEAEQFESYVNQLIRHCDKDYLIFLLKCMCDAVEYNLERYEEGYIYSSNIEDDPEELKQIIKQIREEF